MTGLQTKASGLALAVILVIAGLLLLPSFLALGQTAGLSLSSTAFWSQARLETLGACLSRAALVASAALFVGLPAGLWIGALRNPTLRFVFTAVLVAPYFLVDALKAYMWAEILSSARRAVDPNAPELAAMLSPYGQHAALPALVFMTAPLVATVVSVRYSVILPKIEFFEEVGGGLRWRLAVIGPLLTPYLALAWMLAAGLAFQASVQDDYLGAPLANNLATLMESLVRSHISQAHVFNLVLLAVATGLAGILAVGLGRPGRIGILTKSVWRGAARAGPLLSWIFSGWIGAAVAVMLMALTWMPIAALLIKTTCDLNGCAPWPAFDALAADRSRAAAASSAMVAILALSGGLLAGVAGVAVALSGRHRNLGLVAALTCLLAPGVAAAIALGHAATLLGVGEGNVLLAGLAQAPLLFPYCFGLGLLIGDSLPRTALTTLEEFGPRGSSLAGIHALRYGAAGLVSVAVFSVVISVNDTIRPAYLAGVNEVLSTLITATLQAGRIGGTSDAFPLGLAMVLAGLAGMFWVGLVSHRLAVKGRAIGFNGQYGKAD